MGEAVVVVGVLHSSFVRQECAEETQVELFNAKRGWLCRDGEDLVSWRGLETVRWASGSGGEHERRRGGPACGKRFEEVVWLAGRENLETESRSRFLRDDPVAVHGVETKGFVGVETGRSRLMIFRCFDDEEELEVGWNEDCEIDVRTWPVAIKDEKGSLRIVGHPSLSDRFILFRNDNAQLKMYTVTIYFQRNQLRISPAKALPDVALDMPIRSCSIDLIWGLSRDVSMVLAWLPDSCSESSFAVKVDIPESFVIESNTDLELSTDCQTLFLVNRNSFMRIRLNDYCDANPWRCNWSLIQLAVERFPRDPLLMEEDLGYKNKLIKDGVLSLVPSKDECSWFERELVQNDQTTKARCHVVDYYTTTRLPCPRVPSILGHQDQGELVLCLENDTIFITDGTLVRVGKPFTLLTREGEVRQWFLNFQESDQVAQVFLNRPLSYKDIVAKVHFVHGKECAWKLCQWNEWCQEGPNALDLVILESFLKTHNIAHANQLASELKQSAVCKEVADMVTTYIISNWRIFQARQDFNHLLTTAKLLCMQLLELEAKPLSAAHMAHLDDLQCISYYINHRGDRKGFLEYGALPVLAFDWGSNSWKAGGSPTVSAHDENPPLMILQDSEDMVLKTIPVEVVKRWKWKQYQEIVKDALQNGLMSSAIAFLALKRVLPMEEDALTFLNDEQLTNALNPVKYFRYVASRHIYRLLCNDQMDYMFLAARMLRNMGENVSEFLKKVALHSTRRSTRWRLMKHLWHTVGLSPEEMANARFLTLLESLYPSASFWATFRRRMTLLLGNEYPLYGEDEGKRSNQGGSMMGSDTIPRAFYQRSQYPFILLHPHVESNECKVLHNLRTWKTGTQYHRFTPEKKWAVETVYDNELSRYDMSKGRIPKYDSQWKPVSANTQGDQDDFGIRHSEDVPGQTAPQYSSLVGEQRSPSFRSGSNSFSQENSSEDAAMMEHVGRVCRICAEENELPDDVKTWGGKQWNMGPQTSGTFGRFKEGLLNTSLYSVMRWDEETKERVLMDAGFCLEERAFNTKLRFAMEHNDWRTVFGWVERFCFHNKILLPNEKRFIQETRQLAAYHIDHLLCCSFAERGVFFDQMDIPTVLDLLCSRWCLFLDSSIALQDEERSQTLVTLPRGMLSGFHKWFIRLCTVLDFVDDGVDLLIRYLDHYELLQTPEELKEMEYVFMGKPRVLAKLLLRLGGDASIYRAGEIMEQHCSSVRTNDELDGLARVALRMFSPSEMENDGLLRILQTWNPIFAKDMAKRAIQKPLLKGMSSSNSDCQFAALYPFQSKDFAIDAPGKLMAGGEYVDSASFGLEFFLATGRGSQTLQIFHDAKRENGEAMYLARKAAFSNIGKLSVLSACCWFLRGLGIGTDVLCLDYAAIQAIAQFHPNQAENQLPEVVDLFLGFSSDIGALAADADAKVVISALKLLGEAIRAEKTKPPLHQKLENLFCKVHGLPPSLAFLHELSRDNDILGFLYEAQIENVPPSTAMSIVKDSFTNPSVRDHLMIAIGNVAPDMAKHEDLFQKSQGNDLDWFLQHQAMGGNGILDAIALEKKDSFAILASGFSDVELEKCWLHWLRCCCSSSTIVLEKNLHNILADLLDGSYYDLIVASFCIFDPTSPMLQFVLFHYEFFQRREFQLARERLKQFLASSISTRKHVEWGKRQIERMFLSACDPQKDRTYLLVLLEILDKVQYDSCVSGTHYSQLFKCAEITEIGCGIRLTKAIIFQKSAGELLDSILGLHAFELARSFIHDACVVTTNSKRVTCIEVEDDESKEKLLEKVLMEQLLWTILNQPNNDGKVWDHCYRLLTLYEYPKEKCVEFWFRCVDAFMDNVASTEEVSKILGFSHRYWSTNIKEDGVRKVTTPVFLNFQDMPEVEMVDDPLLQMVRLRSIVMETLLLQGVENFIFDLPSMSTFYQSHHRKQFSLDRGAIGVNTKEFQFCSSLISGVIDSLINEGRLEQAKLVAKHFGSLPKCDSTSVVFADFAVQVTRLPIKEREAGLMQHLNREQLGILPPADFMRSLGTKKLLLHLQIVRPQIGIFLDRVLTTWILARALGISFEQVCGVSRGYRFLFGDVLEKAYLVGWDVIRFKLYNEDRSNLPMTREEKTFTQLASKIIENFGEMIDFELVCETICKRLTDLSTHGNIEPHRVVGLWEEKDMRILCEMIGSLNNVSVLGCCALKYGKNQSEIRLQCEWFILSYYCLVLAIDDVNLNHLLEAIEVLVTDAEEQGEWGVLVRLLIGTKDYDSFHYILKLLHGRGHLGLLIQQQVRMINNLERVNLQIAIENHLKLESTDLEELIECYTQLEMHQDLADLLYEKAKEITTLADVEEEELQDDAEQLLVGKEMFLLAAHYYLKPQPCPAGDYSSSSKMSRMLEESIVRKSQHYSELCLREADHIGRHVMNK